MYVLIAQIIPLGQHYNVMQEKQKDYEEFNVQLSAERGKVRLSIFFRWKLTTIL